MLKALLGGGKSSSSDVRRSSSSRSSRRGEHRSSRSAVSTSSRKSRSSRGDDRDRGLGNLETSSSFANRGGYTSSIADESVASTYVTAQSGRVPFERRSRHRDDLNGRYRYGSLPDIYDPDAKGKRARARAQDGGEERLERRRERTRAAEDDYWLDRRDSDRMRQERRHTQSGDMYPPTPGLQYGNSPTLAASQPPPSPGPSAPYDPHLQQQFPGQMSDFTTPPYLPENPAGAAADYYGDQGESVSAQPGVRPNPPTVIPNSQAHLITASATPNPPPEPSSMGQVGAAADYYSEGANPGQLPPGQPSPSAQPPGPPAPGKPSQPAQGSGSIAPAAATTAATYGVGNLVSYAGANPPPVSAPGGPPSLEPGPGPGPSSGPPPVAVSSYGVGSNPASPPVSSGPPPPSQTQSGVVGKPPHSYGISPALGAAAATAAAGYIIGHHHEESSSSHSSQSHSNTTGYGQFSHSGPNAGGSTYVSSTYGANPNIAMLAAGAAGAAGYTTTQAAQTSNTYYGASYPGPAYQSGPLAFQRRQRGPLSKFIDFWRDPEGVGQFEDYTETIGVCRDCFEPGTTSRDAPRKHHYRSRRYSADRYSSSGSSRIGKSSRYEYASSGEEGRRRKSSKRKSWLTGMLAGYAAKSVLGKDDDDRGISSSHPDRGSGSRYSSYDSESLSTLDRRDSNSRPGYAPSRASRSSGRTSHDYYSDAEIRSSSGVESHSVLKGTGLDVAAGSAALAVAESHRRNRSPKKVRRRKGSSSSDSSSVSASRRKRGSSRSKVSSSGFGSFFTTPSDNRKERRSKKHGGFFFSRNNSSSSSVDADLAFGSELSSKRSGKSKKRRSGHDVDAALIGLGAAGTALAASSVGRRRRTGEVLAKRYARSRRSSVSGSDDDWEDADSDRSSSVSSGLAFGENAVFGSGDSLSSSASGTSRWSWRWGSKKNKKDRRQSSDDYLPAGAVAAAGAIGGAALASAYDRDRCAEAREEARKDTGDLQHVFPVPTSDPTRFDVAKLSSSSFSGGQPPLVRPGAIPLQQPQPVSPVSPAVYYTQPEVQHAQSAPVVPVVPSESALQRYDYRPRDSRREYLNQSRQSTYPDRGDIISGSDLNRIHQGGGSSVGFPTSSQLGAYASSLKRSSAGSKEPATVQFDLTKEQEEKQRRAERRERRRRQDIDLNERPQLLLVDREQEALDRERELEEKRKLLLLQKEQELQAKERELVRREAELQARILREKEEEASRVRQEAFYDPFSQPPTWLRRKDEQDESPKSGPVVSEPPQKDKGKTKASSELPGLGTAAIAAAAGAIGTAAISELSGRIPDDTVERDSQRRHEERREKRRAERRKRYASDLGSEVTSSSRSEEPSKVAVPPTPVPEEPSHVKTSVFRVVSNTKPVYDDYASFFAPEELRHDPTIHTPRDSDGSAVVPAVFEIEPASESFARRMLPSTEPTRDYDRLPWPVPQLILIPPTPSEDPVDDPSASTHQQSASGEVELTKSADHSMTGARVSWGKHHTDEYEVQSSASEADRVEDTAAIAPESTERVNQPEEPLPIYSHDTSVTDVHVEGHLVHDQDIEFESILGVTTAAAGFDPEIVNQTYRAATGSPFQAQVIFEQPPWIQFGPHSNETHGFVEGEVETSGDSDEETKKKSPKEDLHPEAERKAIENVEPERDAKETLLLETDADKHNPETPATQNASGSSEGHIISMPGSFEGEFSEESKAYDDSHTSKRNVEETQDTAASAIVGANGMDDEQGSMTSPARIQDSAKDIGANDFVEKEKSSETAMGYDGSISSVGKPTPREVQSEAGAETSESRYRCQDSSSKCRSSSCRDLYQDSDRAEGKDEDKIAGYESRRRRERSGSMGSREMMDYVKDRSVSDEAHAAEPPLEKSREVPEPAIGVDHDASERPLAEAAAAALGLGMHALSQEQPESRSRSPSVSEKTLKSPKKMASPELRQELPQTPRQRQLSTESPTAIPLHFFRPPTSPRVRLGPVSGSSQAAAAPPDSPTQQSRHRRGKSTEFKNSREFRPLWLVERHGAARADAVPDEPLPSLPSSRSTSAASVPGDDKADEMPWEPADFPGLAKAPRRPEALEILPIRHRHHYSVKESEPEHEDEREPGHETEPRGSLEVTPTAATFGVIPPLSLSSPTATTPTTTREKKPHYEFHSPSELLHNPFALELAAPSELRDLTTSVEDPGHATLTQTVPGPSTAAESVKDDIEQVVQRLLHPAEQALETEVGTPSQTKELPGGSDGLDKDRHEFDLRDLPSLPDSQLSTPSKEQQPTTETMIGESAHEGVSTPPETGISENVEVAGTAAAEDPEETENKEQYRSPILESLSSSWEEIHESDIDVPPTVERVPSPRDEHVPSITGVSRPLQEAPETTKSGVLIESSKSCGVAVEDPTRSVGVLSSSEDLRGADKAESEAESKGDIAGPAAAGDEQGNVEDIEEVPTGTVPVSSEKVEEVPHITDVVHEGTSEQDSGSVTEDKEKALPGETQALPEVPDTCDTIQGTIARLDPEPVPEVKEKAHPEETEMLPHIPDTVQNIIPRSDPEAVPEDKEKALSEELSAIVPPMRRSSKKKKNKNKRIQSQEPAVVVPEAEPEQFTAAILPSETIEVAKDISEPVQEPEPVPTKTECKFGSAEAIQDEAKQKISIQEVDAEGASTATTSSSKKAKRDKKKKKRKNKDVVADEQKEEPSSVDATQASPFVAEITPEGETPQSTDLTAISTGTTSEPVEEGLMSVVESTPATLGEERTSPSVEGLDKSGREPSEEPQQSLQEISQEPVIVDETHASYELREATDQVVGVFEETPAITEEPIKPTGLEQLEEAAGDEPRTISEVALEPVEEQSLRLDEPDLTPEPLAEATGESQKISEEAPHPSEDKPPGDLEHDTPSERPPEATVEVPVTSDEITDSKSTEGPSGLLREVGLEPSIEEAVPTSEEPTAEEDNQDTESLSNPHEHPAQSPPEEKDAVFKSKELAESTGDRMDTFEDSMQSSAELSHGPTEQLSTTLEESPAQDETGMFSEPTQATEDVEKVHRDTTQTETAEHIKKSPESSEDVQHSVEDTPTMPEEHQHLEEAAEVSKTPSQFVQQTISPSHEQSAFPEEVHHVGEGALTEAAEGAQPSGENVETAKKTIERATNMASSQPVEMSLKPSEEISHVQAEVMMSTEPAQPFEEAHTLNERVIPPESSESSGEPTMEEDHPAQPVEESDSPSKFDNMPESVPASEFEEQAPAAGVQDQSPPPTEEQALESEPTKLEVQSEDPVHASEESGQKTSMEENTQVGGGGVTDTNLSSLSGDEGLQEDTVIATTESPKIGEPKDSTTSDQDTSDENKTEAEVTVTMAPEVVKHKEQEPSVEPSTDFSTDLGTQEKPTPESDVDKGADPQAADAPSGVIEQAEMVSEDQPKKKDKKAKKKKKGKLSISQNEPEPAHAPEPKTETSGNVDSETSQTGGEESTAVRVDSEKTRNALQETGSSDDIPAKDVEFAPLETVDPSTAPVEKDETNDNSPHMASEVNTSLGPDSADLQGARPTSDKDTKDEGSKKRTPFEGTAASADEAEAIRAASRGPSFALAQEPSEPVNELSAEADILVDPEKVSSGLDKEQELTKVEVPSENEPQMDIKPEAPDAQAAEVEEVTMTPAQKRKAKKERQKQRKRQTSSVDQLSSQETARSEGDAATVDGASPAQETAIVADTASEQLPMAGKESAPVQAEEGARESPEDDVSSINEPSTAKSASKEEDIMTDTQTQEKVETDETPKDDPDLGSEPFVPEDVKKDDVAITKDVVTTEAEETQVETEKPTEETKPAKSNKKKNKKKKRQQSSIDEAQSPTAKESEIPSSSPEPTVAESTTVVADIDVAQAQRDAIAEEPTQEDQAGEQVEIATTGPTEEVQPAASEEKAEVDKVKKRKSVSWADEDILVQSNESVILAPEAEDKTQEAEAPESQETALTAAEQDESATPAEAVEPLHESARETLLDISAESPPVETESGALQSEHGTSLESTKEQETGSAEFHKAEEEEKTQDTGSPEGEANTPFEPEITTSVQIDEQAEPPIESPGADKLSTGPDIQPSIDDADQAPVYSKSKKKKNKKNKKKQKALESEEKTPAVTPVPASDAQIESDKDSESKPSVVEEQPIEESQNSGRSNEEEDGFMSAEETNDPEEGQARQLPSLGIDAIAAAAISSPETSSKEPNEGSPVESPSAEQAFHDVAEDRSSIGVKQMDEPVQEPGNRTADNNAPIDAIPTLDANEPEEGSTKREGIAAEQAAHEASEDLPSIEEKVPETELDTAVEPHENDPSASQLHGIGEDIGGESELVWADKKISSQVEHQHEEPPSLAYSPNFAAHFVPDHSIEKASPISSSEEKEGKSPEVEEARLASERDTPIQNEPEAPVEDERASESELHEVVSQYGKNYQLEARPLNEGTETTQEWVKEGLSSEDSMSALPTDATEQQESKDQITDVIMEGEPAVTETSVGANDPGVVDTSKSEEPLMPEKEDSSKGKKKKKAKKRKQQEKAASKVQDDKPLTENTPETSEELPASTVEPQAPVIETEVAAAPDEHIQVSRGNEVVPAAKDLRESEAPKESSNTDVNPDMMVSERTMSSVKKRKNGKKKKKGLSLAQEAETEPAPEEQLPTAEPEVSPAPTAEDVSSTARSASQEEVVHSEPDLPTRSPSRDIVPNVSKETVELQSTLREPDLPSERSAEELEAPAALVDDAEVEPESNAASAVIDVAGEPQVHADAEVTTSEEPKVDEAVTGDKDEESKERSPAMVETTEEMETIEKPSSDKKDEEKSPDSPRESIVLPTETHESELEAGADTARSLVRKSEEKPISAPEEKPKEVLGQTEHSVSAEFEPRSPSGGEGKETGAPMDETAAQEQTESDTAYGNLSVQDLKQEKPISDDAEQKEEPEPATKSESFEMQLSEPEGAMERLEPVSQKQSLSEIRSDVPKAEKQEDNENTDAEQQTTWKVSEPLDINPLEQDGDNDGQDNELQYLQKTQPGSKDDDSWPSIDWEKPDFDPSKLETSDQEPPTAKPITTPGVEVIEEFDEPVMPDVLSGPTDVQEGLAEETASPVTPPSKKDKRKNKKNKKKDKKTSQQENIEGQSTETPKMPQELIGTLQQTPDEAMESIPASDKGPDLETMVDPRTTVEADRRLSKEPVSNQDADWEIVSAQASSPEDVGISSTEILRGKEEAVCYKEVGFDMPEGSSVERALGGPSKNDDAEEKVSEDISEASITARETRGNNYIPSPTSSMHDSTPEGPVSTVLHDSSTTKLPTPAMSARKETGTAPVDLAIDVEVDPSFDVSVQADRPGEETRSVEIHWKDTDKGEEYDSATVERETPWHGDDVSKPADPEQTSDSRQSAPSEVYDLKPRELQPESSGELSPSPSTQEQPAPSTSEDTLTQKQPGSIFGRHVGDPEPMSPPRTPVRAGGLGVLQGSESLAMPHSTTPQLGMKSEQAFPPPETPWSKPSDDDVARRSHEKDEGPFLGAGSKDGGRLKARRSMGGWPSEMLKTPEHNMLILRPSSAGSIGSMGSVHSTGSVPSLKRRPGGDLRAASRLGKPQRRHTQPPLDVDIERIASSSSYDPVTDKGKRPVRGMTDVYEAWGETPAQPRSPTRPPSVRHRRSMQHLQELESKLDQLISENRLLITARDAAEKKLKTASIARRKSDQALNTSTADLRDKEAEVEQLRNSVDWLQKEVLRLTEENERLAVTNADLAAAHGEELKTVREHSAHELDKLRSENEKLSTGMNDIVRREVDAALSQKNSELRRLREQLETTREKVRELQQQIASSLHDNVLAFRDQEYFEAACQKLCGHVQQWVLRFSKHSDHRRCRRLSDLHDEKLADRFDNTILDGTDVEIYLADRVLRRNVFMSVVMTLLWEYIFTRYLFGMDREQRQKLKALEKQLSEVGPRSAVLRWRATTLALLARRASFTRQRQNDTEAVALEIFESLSRLLPPPSQFESQLLESLRKVLRVAVDLSIEMRTQLAEYIMLPPQQPEYDINGDLARHVHFNASLMNERSGETRSNEELEAQRAKVRIVLFPLVIRKGNDFGEGDDEDVVCPAQVLVARPHMDKRVAKMMSSDRMSLDTAKSAHSTVPPSTMDMI